MIKIVIIIATAFLSLQLFTAKLAKPTKTTQSSISIKKEQVIYPALVY